MIDLPLPDGSAEAHLAVPPDLAAGETRPGVLFFMDAFGLRPQLEAMADRIASWGYVVLVPHLFHRTITVADLAPTADLRMPEERERFFAAVMPHLRALTPELSDADTAGYLAALRARPEVGDGPLGVTGYCMGARLATRAAGNHPDDVAAAAGFHGGRLATEDPDSPHLLLAHARAELVFGHADNDPSMPPEAVVRLGEALAAAGLTATNEVYAGAQHGFTMADTSSYDEAAAERSFRELRALLGRHLEHA
ncbi:dienelactone hydrolase family protein [Nocardioides ultimimeridianus]